MSNNPGSITLFKGPMFSGKTESLLKRVHKEEVVRKRSCVFIKYAKDSRYNVGYEEIRSHGQNMRSDVIPVLSLSQLEDVTEYRNRLTQAAVVAIDEGQFYPDLVEFCERMAQCGKEVLVSALSSKFDRNPWEKVAQLEAKADFIKVKYAWCTEQGCGRNTLFTMRTIADKSEVIIGAGESYTPRCREHHHIIG
jgi:thymidine kinase